jgi:hypothetical protein
MAKIKFQNVKFKTVQEFLDYLPENELKVVNRLRKIVFDCLPDVTEKLSYNVPFYKVHKTICFIWPASVKWGKQQTYEGVRFGFANGNLMSDSENYLEKGSRKQVYWRTFSSVKEINEDILKTYIFEAAIIDQDTKSSKTKKLWNH